MTRRITNPLHLSARRFAERGTPVFPLVPGTKVPFKGSRGVLDGTTDLDRIDYWWRVQPWANVAACTGHAFDALDIDGETGVWSLLQLYGEGARRKQLRGPMVKTPSGGFHLYVQPTGHGNRADFRPRLDWRGRLGYVLAPPSVLADGGRYEWSYEGQTWRTAPRPAHDWLIAALEGTDEIKPPRGSSSQRRLILVDGDLLDLIQYKADEVRRALVGSRNHTLNGCAFFLGRRIGGSPHYEDIVRRELFAAGMYLSQTAPASDPFPPREVHSALESGLRAGMARPVVELGIAI